MGMITLYRGAYGENPQQFPTCFFDLENAAIDTDYTIHTAEATFPPTGNTVKAVRLDITQAGMLHFAGVQTDIYSPANLCKPWKMVYDAEHSTVTPEIDASLSMVTLGEKPEDWETAYFWKYYTRQTQSLYGVDVVYYRGIETWNNSFDPTTQYYYTDQITQPFYTLARGFFACANSNVTGQQIFSTICHTGTSYINVNYDGQYSAPGFFGTRLFSADVIGSAHRDLTISLSADTTSRNLIQLCEFTYNEERYIGVAVLEKSAEGFLVSASVLACTSEFWQGLPAPPYFGPTSSINAGQGTFNDESQPVPITEIPDSFKASDFGAGMHIRALDDGAVSQLFSQLWAQDSFFSSWKNVRFDPYSCIMSLHKIPYLVTGGGSASLSIATTHFLIQNRTIGARIKDINLGIIALPEYYGSRLDYAPHTNANIFLPFCGEYPLDITDIMGGSLALTYRIDFATGDCIAFLMGTDRRGLQTLSKSYKGNCAFKIPVSGSDGGGAGMLSGLMSMLGGAVTLAAGNVPGGAMQIAGGLINAGTSKVNNSVTTVQGSASAFSELIPYIKIYRSVQARPENYELLKADSAAAGGTVAQTGDGYQISGYTVYSAVEMQIAGATDAEKREIETLLKSGVYV